MIKQTLQKLSSLIQSSTGSFKRHNSQYEEAGKLEKERDIGLRYLANNQINSSELKINDLISEYKDIKCAIDIGSGTGWSAAALSQMLEKVIAIEPSGAAIDMSKTLYPAENYPNIEWVTGFAEEVLNKQKLTSPTLFLTSCVLNHIRDQEVIKICEAMSQVAPKGSVLSFAENWGDASWHQLMWHVRTKDWWREQLPGWELDFHGLEVQEKDKYKGRYHIGFHGVKVS